jgi:selenocysteine lyase/cysteine desulfurase
MEENPVKDADQGLIPKSEFIGLDNIVHLCTGGESPVLKTHREAIDRFLADKALGEASRKRMDDAVSRCKTKAGQLLGVAPEDIALLSSSSEGVNILVHGLEWNAGDNVVICDVEFPSEIIPWSLLQKKGVDIRIVRNRNWYMSLDDIGNVVDKKTRLIAVSSVSYFTGQRLSMKRLSEIAGVNRSLLLVDATHEAGVVPVEAAYADILVSSCYKWLLATHGVAIFYWNKKRLADLSPPFLGWHSTVSMPDWRNPLNFELRPDAGKFEPANHSFISVYVLENALNRILEIGVSSIEKHVLHLSGKLWEGLNELGYEIMTPENPEERAGNVCFMTDHIQEVTEALADRGIRIWGGYAGVGRVRVSTHLYNTEEDVDKLLAALKELPDSIKG